MYNARNDTRQLIFYVTLTVATQEALQVPYLASTCGRDDTYKVVGRSKATCHTFLAT